MYFDIGVVGESIRAIRTIRTIRAITATTVSVTVSIASAAAAVCVVTLILLAPIGGSVVLLTVATPVVLLTVATSLILLTVATPVILLTVATPVILLTLVLLTLRAAHAALLVCLSVGGPLLLAAIVGGIGVCGSIAAGTAAASAAVRPIATVIVGIGCLDGLGRAGRGSCGAITIIALRTTCSLMTIGLRVSSVLVGARRLAGVAGGGCLCC